jgi:uncharacterized damage-inducible protein DinB
MSHSSEISAELIREIKYRLYNEFMPRIHLCLDQLTDEQVWWRPNETSNSVGNLVLHLAGNVRQWIIAGLGDKPDVRKRQLEFDERKPLPKDDLEELLNSVLAECEPVLNAIGPDDLLKRKPVQVFEESVITILIHVTEHFSYHTGQIAWITKMMTDSDLGFYKEMDLG